MKWKLVHTVPRTELVTVGNSCNHWQSYNIRNYKSSTCFCVVDRSDLYKSLSGLAQRNGDEE